jgi:hypothetical protein
MSKQRIVVELDIDIADPNWTKQDVLDNLPTYLALAISSAEQRASAGPYEVDSDSVTIWYPEDYLDEMTTRRP